MTVYALRQQTPMGVGEETRAAWSIITRHWRRVLLSTVPLLALSLWTVHKDNPLELVGTVFFVFAGILLLCVGFERQIARHARVWQIFVALESISLFWLGLDWLIEWWGQSVGMLTRDPDVIPTSARGVVTFLWASQLMLVWWLITYVFPYTTDDLRLKKLEMDRLRRAAELARLRSNLEPHFLLNTLNAIAGMVSDDPKEARRLIAALGDLLGDSLDDRDTETLGEQIEWLRQYARILEVRHRDRLRISWEVAEEAQHIVVPRLLLQPLLENAVNHGALFRHDGGEVHVRASVTRDATAATLICEVQDNGPGLRADAPRDGAKGIALVQSRLQAMDVGARFRFEPGHPGTRAILEMSLRERVAREGE